MKSLLLLVLAVALAGVGYGQLKAHQSSAHKLAQAVAAKDVAGADAAPALATLKAYTSKHMETAETVMLDGSYKRAAAAAIAAGNPGSNGAVYAAAQAACGGHSDSITQAKCVQAYVASNSTSGANPQAVAAPNLADYTKSFPSPSWTPDSAGLCLLGAVIAAAAALYLVILRIL